MMVEVDEQVYNLVVVPHKKNKSFSKLIATLLNGYVSNMYIRGFADDTLDGIHKEAVNSLDSIIGDMHESLASMGMYTEELGNTLNDGIQTFTQAKEDAEENTVSMDDILGEQGFGSYGVSKDLRPKMIGDKTGAAQLVKEVVSEENDKLRNEVNDLKAQNSLIMDMLKELQQSIISGNIQAVARPTEVIAKPIEVAKQPTTEASDVTEAIIREFIKEPATEKVEEVKEVDDIKTINQGILEDDEPSEEDEAEANDIMASLLSGNVFSF